MLFIGDDEAEITKFNILLNNRVSADNKVGFAAFYTFFNLSLFLRLSAAREQIDSYALVLKQLCKGSEMLFGKNLGRSHKSGLHIIPGDRVYKRRSDNRFSRTDVAL